MDEKKFIDLLLEIAEIDEDEFWNEFYPYADNRWVSVFQEKLILWHIIEKLKERKMDLKFNK